MSKGRRSGIIEIDVRDYLDDLIDECLDTEDTLYVRDCLEEAKRCLSRRERTPAEALGHIENALGVVLKALPYPHTQAAA